jgi:hypothetical protein
MTENAGIRIDRGMISKRGRMVMNKTGFRMACLAGTIGLLSPAFATEQVYHPISPALGGASANGPFLLSTAQSQGEGANSANQNPTINITNPPTPTIPSQTGAANVSGANASGANVGGTATGGATVQTARRVLANPLGTNSGMP